MAIPAPLRLRRLGVTALGVLGVLGLSLTAVTLPAGAHDDRGGADAPAADCPPGQERAGERAGDNFKLACLPGQDLAQLDDSAATLKPGEIDKSANIELLANIPKSGPFAGEASFQTDLAFQGDYAFQGNYDGLSVYDISKPHKPRLV